jgi:hypothetical protein
VKKRTLVKIVGAGIVATAAALLVKMAVGEAEQNIVGGFFLQ